MHSAPVAPVTREFGVSVGPKLARLNWGCELRYAVTSPSQRPSGPVTSEGGCGMLRGGT